MGFGCGFYKVNKKSDKELSYDDYQVINDYYDYEANKDFYGDRFSTFESYRDRFGHSPSSVTQEITDAYKDEYQMRDYHCSIFEGIADWCSSGACFHKWILNNLFDNDVERNDGVIRITREKCLKLLKHCVERLEDFEIKPVRLDRAFTEKWDDDEDPDRSTITSIPCDGIEVSDELGNLKRLYGEYADDSEIFTFEDNQHDSYYDGYVAYKRLLLVVTNLLTDTDWDNQVVFYSGGW